MISCQFCGHQAASAHGASIHRVRCPKNPDRKVWSRTGVRNGTARRKEPQTHGKPTSYCHDAPVRTGRPHDHGDKYCTKCGEACYWRANKYLPTFWSCKEDGCKSQVHWKNGYCKRHWEKRNKPLADDDMAAMI